MFKFKRPVKCKNPPGRCPYGSSCNYAHSEKEFIEAKKRVIYTKSSAYTKPCRNGPMCQDQHTTCMYIHVKKLLPGRLNLFNGGVKEALEKAETNNTIMAGIITGPSEDKATVELNKVLEDKEIVSRFATMVCLRLESGSPACSQFAAIYPVITVPSVYFIGDVMLCCNTTTNCRPPPVLSIHCKLGQGRHSF